MYFEIAAFARLACSSALADGTSGGRPRLRCSSRRSMVCARASSLFRSITSSSQVSGTRCTLRRLQS